MEQENIIDLLGGSTVVARDIGAPVTTVHAWKSSGRIPSWRRPAIAQLAHAKGVALPDGFVPGDFHAEKDAPPAAAPSPGSTHNPAPKKVEDQK